MTVQLPADIVQASTPTGVDPSTYPVPCTYCQVKGREIAVSVSWETDDRTTESGYREVCPACVVAAIEEATADPFRVTVPVVEAMTEADRIRAYGLHRAEILRAAGRELNAWSPARADYPASAVTRAALVWGCTR